MADDELRAIFMRNLNHYTSQLSPKKRTLSWCNRGAVEPKNLCVLPKILCVSQKIFARETAGNQ